MTARSKIGLPGCSYDAACIAGMALSSEAASVPIPKFASLCGAVACELRNRKRTLDLSFWRGWGRVSFCAAEARAFPRSAAARLSLRRRAPSEQERQWAARKPVSVTSSYLGAYRRRLVDYSHLGRSMVEIHHIRHVRRFRRGIQLYGGQSRPFGCACGQRGCRPRQNQVQLCPRRQVPRPLQRRP